MAGSSRSSGGPSEQRLVDRYLNRLGLSEAPPATVDGLAQLMQIHMTSVPFENLDVFWQQPVTTAVEHSVGKIIDRSRGGWCFELNGAFGHLLTMLGYQIRMLGAAVLLGGPSDVVDHLTLEVLLEGRPHLVDVGFGDGFARPLPLNGKADQPIDAHTGQFGFLPSSRGTTLVRYADDGSGPRPQYRFRRVSVALTDLAPSSDALYQDADSNFRKGPLATRLIDGGPRRVTLTTDRLRFTGPDGSDDHTVEPLSDDWFGYLQRWFAIGGDNLPPGAEHT